MTIFASVEYVIESYFFWGAILGFAVWIYGRQARKREGCTGLRNFLVWEIFHAFFWLPMLVKEMSK
jgi:hypothetical protein